MDAEKVWRYVGCVITIMVVVCVRDPSFKSQFREMNLLDFITRYTYSFILCLINLEVFVSSITCHRISVHLTSAALIVAHVYPYLEDKVINEKADGRQYSLIELLVKINLVLTISGIGIKNVLFSGGYSSATISFENDRVQDEYSEVTEAIQAQDEQLARTDMDATTTDDSFEDAASVEQLADIGITIEPLMTCMRAIQQGNSNVTHTTLHELVEKYLDENSELALMDHFLYECASLELPIGAMVPSSGTLNDLHVIAQQMIDCGFEKVWSHVYTTSRRKFLEESISKLGFQRRSIDNINNMTLQDLEDQIEPWIKASNVVFKILFPGERQLCDRIYFGHSVKADVMFIKVCEESAIELLNFARVIVIGSRSPERLLRIVVMFEALRDLIPVFEALFSDQLSMSLRNEAITIWKRLRDVIRTFFIELESSIRLDRSNTVVTGGGIHPMNQHVMKYLCAACRSWQTLLQVFEDHGHPINEYPRLDDRVSSSSSFSLLMQMNWIMEELENNLEVKSKIYKDPALSCVFMINNVLYIVHETKDSELGTLLGDDWIREQVAKVSQFHRHYTRSSWNEVIGFLEVGSMPPNDLALMKGKLKSFNMLFEEKCKDQSSWVAFDEQFRNDMIVSVGNILLPAYRNFVWRFKSVPQLAKRTDKYVKYEMEDIEARLYDLFKGSNG